MKINYTEKSDYLIPDLALPPQTTYPISRYGRLHKEYIKNYKKGFYKELSLSGKLNEYLYEIDVHAKEMMEFLVAQLAKNENVTEELKSRNQMAWVGTMNNIRARAEEVVLHD